MHQIDAVGQVQWPLQARAIKRTCGYRHPVGGAHGYPMLAIEGRYAELSGLIAYRCCSLWLAEGCVTT